MEAPHPTTAPTTNGLGIAGFVCSVLGILGSCGLLSPIGLILSLVAVGRQPRGFAIAGIVIGALGTCFVLIPLAILALVMPVVLFGILGAVGLTSVLGPDLGAKIEMAQIAGAIEMYQQDHTMLPISIDDLDIADTELLTDQWGHPYGYELAEDGLSYRLFSVGPDGIAGTADDIAANPDWVTHSFSSEAAFTAPPPSGSAQPSGRGEPASSAE